ncbi:MAG: HAD-IIA family hydrolase [Acidaminococcales bacterium]|nr:HAD-IIA family hydrolase [Acidaminococcales bacterium]
MDVNIKKRIAKIKCFLFDMDGTVYLGSRLLPGAAETLAALKAGGRKYCFLTNNSSRDPAYYRNKLRKMGIETKSADIIISSHSLLDYLSGQPGRRLFVLGVGALKSLLRKGGHTVVSEGGRAVDYVVVGFDTGLNYKNLVIACQYVDGGAPYIATHPDVRCPLEDGRYIPDCGSLLALIKAATGKDCLITAGKPSRYMIAAALRRTGFKPEELAVVGDRLYTDIALGCAAGIFSILLLSGETTVKDLENSAWQPDLILNGIGDMLDFLRA